MSDSVFKMFFIQNGLLTHETPNFLHSCNTSKRFIIYINIYNKLASIVCGKKYKHRTLQKANVDITS